MRTREEIMKDVKAIADKSEGEITFQEWTKLTGKLMSLVAEYLLDIRELLSDISGAMPEKKEGVP